MNVIVDIFNTHRDSIFVTVMLLLAMMAYGCGANEKFVKQCNQLAKDCGAAVDMCIVERHVCANQKVANEVCEQEVERLMKMGAK